MSPRPPSAPSGSDVEAALDRLLQQVVTGFFVLTDGQGNLSKWSEPAEFLFGLGPDEALGEPMFGKLMSPPYGQAGDAWKRFLEEDVPPGTSSAATLTARHPDAGKFPVEAVFVPVKLDEGFDFSLFLEDLSFELPMDLMLVRMRQQHPVVIGALRQALSGAPLPWEGWRTAGTLVIFTPQAPTPWIEDAMRRREEERALAEEEAQSRIQAYEAPPVRGSDVHDLEDAAAVVERLRWATERIEDLEERSRIAEGAAQEVAEARKRAEAAEKAAIDARAQLTEALTKADAEVVATSEAERLELTARLDRIERAAQEAAEAASEHRIAAERERQRVGEAQRQALELGKRLEALERDLVATTEASRSAAAERARIEAEAAVERATRTFAERIEAIEKARGDSTALVEAEGRAEASRAELQIRLEALERHQHDEWQQLREEVADLKVAAADAVELRAQLKQVQAAVGEATTLKSEVARTREEMEALRRSGPDSGLLSQIRRFDPQAADVSTLRAELEQVRQAAGSVEPLRAQVEGVLQRLDQVSQQVAELGPRPESRIHPPSGVIAAERERLDEAHRRADEAQREAEQAKAATEALRAQAEELRAQATELRDETQRLKSELGDLREDDGDRRHDIDGLRQEQKLIRELLEEARRERDESREQLGDVLRQVEDAKATAARQAAEQAARSLGGTESQIHQRLERTATEFEGFRRDVEAARTRLAELAGTANSAERRAEQAQEAADALRDQVADLREEARDAQRMAREATERIDQVDRGAASVLDEVRAQKEAVDAVAESARAAGESAAEGRLDAAEAKAAAARAEQELAAAGERLKALGQDVAAALEQSSAATQAAEAAREDAVAAAREAGAEAAGGLRDELSTLRTGLEEARRDLDERLADDPAEALAALQADVGARLEELRGQVDAVASRGDEAGERTREAVEALEQALGTLRAELGDRAAAGDVAALRADLEALREKDATPAVAELTHRLDLLEQREDHASAAALESLRADLETRVVALESRDIETVVDARLGEMAAELMAARTETEAVRRSLDDLRHEMQAVREYAASAKAEGTSAIQLATAAQTAAAHTDLRIDELRGEVSDASRLVEELRGHADEVRRAAAAAKAAAERAASAEKGTSARFTEVWDELIKKSRSSSSGVRKSSSGKPKEKPPAREPREGFDDQERPMATIGLDGKFKELNPGFTRLIGYDEHEFQRAAWPSVHDRAVYQDQVAALRRMVAGELESFQVRSTYVHGQGLMVPVTGRLELVRDEEGAPSHLLLVAEDRQHA